MSGNNFTLPDVGHKKSPEKVTPGMENCVILSLYLLVKDYHETTP
ncbi:hypothetical protein [Acinetobacter schindleri]|nr:hypothetical protein [Acinetobacter schindleri]